MSDPAEDGEDLLGELASVVSALRSHIEWQVVLGAPGLPRDRRSPHELKVAAEANLEPELRGGRPSAAEADPKATPARAQPSGSEAKSDPADSISHQVTVSTPRIVSLPVSKTLDELNVEVQNCTKCALHAGRTQTVFSRGRGTSGLCFVGEGPGAEEDAQGLPFVGAAGQLLDKMIQAMGFDQDEIYICNIVKCRPPNNRKPAEEEMAACRGYLQQQLALVQPQVIVALGATAVLGLLGETRGITKIRGNFRLYQSSVVVMPTFHPAYLLRNPAAKKEVWSDLQKVVHHMGRTLPTRG